MTISRELYSRALELLPGGVSSPVRSLRAVSAEPVYMSGGRGARLFDEDGNGYLDFCMCWGAQILGHADPKLLQALKGACESGFAFGTSHRYEPQLAERIVEFFPSIEKLRFVNSGTEAVMSALRLARGYTGRDKIVKFEGAYHGHGDSLLVAAGSGLATYSLPASAGVTRANARDTVVLPYNSFERVEEYFRAEGACVAAVIVEPVMCNCALTLPRDCSGNFLSLLRRLCDDCGALLIFDEVITGFRLCGGGAQEYYGIRADLSTLGKIIGAGLPLALYGGRGDIMDRVAPGGDVYQAGTLSGNPLALAVALAVVERLSEPNFYARLAEKAAHLCEKLAPLLKRYSPRIAFEQIGSIFCLSFLDAEGEIDPRSFADYFRRMLKRGIYLSPSAFEVDFLSDAHTGGDIELFVDASAQVLYEMLDGK